MCVEWNCFTLNANSTRCCKHSFVASCIIIKKNIISRITSSSSWCILEFDSKTRRSIYAMEFDLSRRKREGRKRTGAVKGFPCARLVWLKTLSILIFGKACTRLQLFCCENKKNMENLWLLKNVFITISLSLWDRDNARWNWMAIVKVIAQWTSLFTYPSAPPASST